MSEDSKQSSGGGWHEEKWPSEVDDSCWKRRVWQPAMKWVDDNLSSRVGGLEEDEDSATAVYLSHQDEILTGTYSVSRFNEDMEPPTWTAHRCPRFLTDEQVRTETDAAGSVEFAFGDDICHTEAPGSLHMATGTTGGKDGRPVTNRLSYNGDIFEIRTRHFLWERMRIEQRDIAGNTFFLLFFLLLEIILGVVIFVMAVPHASGGKRMVFLSGLVSAIVMIGGALCGAAGAAGQNERLIRLFLTGSYWTLSILTTLLYVEFDHYMETENECTASETDASGGAGSSGCETTRFEIFLLLVFAVAGLGITFVCNYLCGACLDGMNDLTKIADSTLLLRYFHYRQNVLRNWLMRLCGTRQQFTHSMYHDDGVGMLGTFDDISPAVVVALGMRDYKFTKHRCDAGEGDKRNRRPAQLGELCNPPWSKPGRDDDEAAPGAPQGV
eukprot:TRINITY_DN55412_c0_g1_i1.p1 TRINITY_DN55412_c0_g1~~TRINITY_DN55412_c0_g1_i1.p1  ORF type:complete len:467 (+),score=126.26 TRINITY_DN55412_c0_g1_i1:83-1402(+)